MRVMSDAIRFDFDFVSPNAYLAWTRLPALAERHGRALEPVPVLFAALLEAHGQLGPAEVPPKIRWMTRNNLRKAAVLGVELNPPAFHPFNPILALRVSSLVLDPSRRRTLIDALFRAVWVRGLHVSEPGVVEAIGDEIGLPGSSLVAQAQEPDAAIARGVFGVPTMEVGDELFWGYDDLPHLERFLAGNDPLDATSWQRWAAGSLASAVRPRARPARE